jgi:serine/threonine protein kinase/tetratricopeptide (TPR) repeat protein
MLAGLFEEAPSRPRVLGAYRLLDVIGEGGMGIVYRAEHEITRERVAIKTVRVRHERQLEGLRREIYALGRIRHPGVVRILDEGIHDGVPWYAMELLSGESLSDYNWRAWSQVNGPYPDELDTRNEKTPVAEIATSSARDDAMPFDPRRPAAAGRLEHVLSLVRQLCASLAFLHGEGIVHRDLKSANVFLCADGRPVLIDFGLVWRFPGPIGREVIDVSAALAGTAGYMAPEQILGELVDARADLYAVGCILYETITGRLPFRNKPLITKMSIAPPLPSHLVDRVPPALDALILHLLEARPRDRIGHADDIVRALDAILSSEAPPPRDSQAPRAYVYRPELTGRDDVIHLLTERLEGLELGDGGCVALRGESGIGKTYVAMALARIANARGLSTIAGACVPLGASEASGHPNEAPLHPFARFFESIADRCVEHGREKTDRLLGARGKILAACDPRLATLPGQDAYASPPEVPAQVARQRLFTALAETLSEYAAEWPLVLVLDDLQWADELSLRFLLWLEPSFFEERPLLLLATYRAEETSEALSELAACAHVTHVDLGPLDAEAIGAIASDMLGLDHPPPTFVRELAAKAEGNPFFVGEYLRAAVDGGLVRRDSAGRWIVEDDRPLPLPGTLRDLVRRRLLGLSEEARVLLEAASVLGREVDGELLAIVRGASLDAQRGAMRELVARQVLEEAEPGHLRFLHDKLREHTYEQIDEARRRATHLAAARALEARGATASGALALLYPRLAHHFTQAGVKDKALFYLEKAGEQALGGFANRDAIRFFREALAEDGALGEALPTRHAVAALPHDVRLRRARWERQMADAHYALGELAEIETHARRALHWLGEAHPQSSGAWTADLAKNVPAQIAHRLLPRAFAAKLVAKDDDERARMREAAIAMQRLAVRFYYNFDALPMIACSLRAVNLSERAGSSVSVATTYGMLSMTVGISKLHALGSRYAELARDVARASDDRAGLIFALYAEAAWRVGDGAWSEVRALCNEALALGEAGGAPDPQDVAIAKTLLAHVDFYTGRFEESRRTYGEIEAAARVRGNDQHIAWGLYAAARALIPLGQVEQARTMLEEAHQRLEGQIDVPSRIICPGLLASVYLTLGDRANALTFADLAAARIVKNLPTVFATVAGYVGVAEVYLAEWERAIRRGGSVRAARGAVRRAVMALGMLAWSIPLGRPYYHRIKGREQRIAGRARAARRSFARALAWATRLEMPYEEALALASLGALEPRGSRARASHLRRAEALFSELGCIDDLARARTLAD